VLALKQASQLQSTDSTGADSDSSELAPGQDSSDEETKRAKEIQKKRAGIEAGIPIAEYRLDIKPNSRLVYGNFDSALKFTRRIGKVGINGKEVREEDQENQGKTKYKGNTIKPECCKFLRGWENLTRQQIEQRVFEKLVKKGRMEVTTWAEFLERRTKLEDAQAKRHKRLVALTEHRIDFGSSTGRKIYGR
jgi:hypothetical protein